MVHFTPLFMQTKGMSGRDFYLIFTGYFFSYQFF